MKRKKLQDETLTNAQTRDPEAPGWIWLISGRRFWPGNPHPDDVTIEDIAHNLSMLCRYTGAVKTFYSVAEHCVRVSEACDPKDALLGLIHDAAEAYVADLSRPLKRIETLYPVWKPIEQRVHEAVCAKFKLPSEMPESVHRADDILAITEMRDLSAVPRPRVTYVAWDEALAETIVPWEQDRAKREFLSRWVRLRGLL